MTDEQKYNELLKELAELIVSKNNFISYKEFEVDRLKRLLEIAENKIEELEKG